MAKTGKKGTVHFTNEDLDGLSVKIHNLPDGKFGFEIVLPESVKEQIDFDKIESGEHPDGYYTMDQLFEVAIMIGKNLTMHPDCHEAANFDGTKEDVSEIGIDKIIASALQEAAQETYEDEKRRGIIPDGLSFEDWLEIEAGGSGGSGTLH